MCVCVCVCVRVCDFVCECPTGCVNNELPVAWGQGAIMGGRESAPVSPEAPPNKIFILVVGSCHLGVTRPERLVKKFLKAGERRYRKGSSETSSQENCSATERVVYIDDVPYGVVLMNLEHRMSLRFDFEGVRTRMLRDVRQLSPRVGVLIVYNPVVLYSFENALMLVDTLVPEPGINGAPPEMNVPVVLVLDGCDEPGPERAPYSTAMKCVENRPIPVVAVCGELGTNVELAFMTLIAKVVCNSTAAKTRSSPFHTEFHHYS